MSELPKSSGSHGGLGSGKGLGGGGSLNTPLERRDPSSFGPASFNEESNANWNRASLAMTAGISESWFGADLVSTTVEDRIQQLGLPKNYLELPEGFLSERIPDGFATSFGLLGELQPLSGSPFAQKVISYLNGRGVTAIEHGLLQLSSNTFVNMNDLDGSKGANASLEPGGGGSNTWMGPWGSGFGSRFLQNFRVYKNEDGVETGVWFANAIVGTRPAERGGEGELESQEKFRREIMIPTLAKRLFYLAETPFPSSMATLGRNLAFSDLDESMWPRPHCSVNDFELTVCTIENFSSNPETNFHIFPQVVNLGWTFTATEMHELEVIVPSIIDALTVMISILEDGFRNYPTLESPFSWADFFGPFDDEVQGAARAKTARWVPATQIGALVRLSNELNSRGHHDSNDQDFAWVAENGAGASVASCINSLAYGYLLPTGRLVEAREYLAAAIAVDHFNESTNALANLGQVLLAAGEDELAETTFLAALDRPDKYSEGEASLFLGDLYAKQGDAKRAKKCYERASESGHEVFAPAAFSRLSGDSQLNESPGAGLPSTESSTLARFCSNCGASFSGNEQRFCAGCGTQRAS